MGLRTIHAKQGSRADRAGPTGPRDPKAEFFSSKPIKTRYRGVTQNFMPIRRRLMGLRTIHAKRGSRADRAGPTGPRDPKTEFFSSKPIKTRYRGVTQNFMSIRRRLMGF
ncbi:hypothetical protein Hdeb2414_s0005g00152961 [Helianthus debilis subsp. tardiflorus]